MELYCSRGPIEREIKTIKIVVMKYVGEIAVGFVGVIFSLFDFDLVIEMVK